MSRSVAYHGIEERQQSAKVFNSIVARTRLDPFVHILGTPQHNTYPVREIYIDLPVPIQ